jgi:predicted metalloprotease with PDZ domain
VGLEVGFRVRESSADKGGTPPPRKGSDSRPKGWLGLAFKGHATVAWVVEGSPAMEAGIYPEDEVVALDGYKVDGAALLSRCEDRRPGETAQVTLFRRDKLMELPVILAQRPADTAYLRHVDKPTDAQKAAFQAWLGAAWDEAVG